MHARVAANEVDELNVIRDQAQHRPESGIASIRIEVWLQDVLIQICTKKVRQAAVIRIVCLHEGGDFREAAPSVAPRPRSVDNRLQLDISHRERRLRRRSTPRRKWVQQPPP